MSMKRRGSNTWTIPCQTSNPNCFSFCNSHTNKDRHKWKGTYNPNHYAKRSFLICFFLRYVFRAVGFASRTHPGLTKQLIFFLVIWLYTTPGNRSGMYFIPLPARDGFRFVSLVSHGSSPMAFDQGRQRSIKSS